MSLTIDIIAFLVLVIIFCIGFKRGFLKTIASLVFIILAGMIASFCADALEKPIYEKWVYPAFKEKLTVYVTDVCDNLTNDSQTFNEIFKNYHSNLLTANEMSDIIKSQATNFTQNLGEYLKTHELPFGLTLSEATLESLSTAMSEDETAFTPETVPASTADIATTPTEQIADFIIGYAIRPTAMRFIGTILFLVIFVLLSICFGLIVRALGIIDKIPVLGTVNSIAGGICGVIFALFILYFALIIVGYLGENGFVSETVTEAVNKTYTVRVMDLIDSKLTP
jgi:uncharacterized membrane protein required for colicin V production